jgi:hypothetical protein
MHSRGDATEISQGSDQTYGAVTTHAEVSDIIKEDHPGSTDWVNRGAEQSAYDHIGSTWFIGSRFSEKVVFSPEDCQSL